MTVAHLQVAPDPTNAALRRLALLLSPPHGPHDSSVWVHDVLPRGLPVRGLLAAAVRREWTLQRARWQARDPSTRPAVHRVQPGMPRKGPRARALALIRSGAVVERAPAAAVRDIDNVAASCRATLQGRLHAGSGGIVLARATILGQPAVLRIAGTEAELATHLAALTRLGGTAGRVPTLLAAGSSRTAAWTAETTLPGRRPRRLTSALFADAVAFECALPRSNAAGATVRPDLELLGALFPRHARRLARLADAVDTGLQSMPAVVGHGDLWAGNLLVRGGRLTGVVDWDAYSDRVVPGVDLLHLFATEVAIRLRRPRGMILVDHPWAGEDFRDATTAYWRTLGVRLTPALLATVSVAWWAAQTAADLRRNPSLRENTAWVSANIDQVVERHTHERL